MSDEKKKHDEMMFNEFCRDEYRDEYHEALEQEEKENEVKFKIFYRI